MRLSGGISSWRGLFWARVVAVPPFLNRGVCAASTERLRHRRPLLHLVQHAQEEVAGWHCCHPQDRSP